MPAENLDGIDPAALRLPTEPVVRVQHRDHLTSEHERDREGMPIGAERCKCRCRLSGARGHRLPLRQHRGQEPGLAPIGPHRPGAHRRAAGRDPLVELRAVDNEEGCAAGFGGCGADDGAQHAGQRRGVVDGAKRAHQPGRVERGRGTACRIERAGGALSLGLERGLCASASACSARPRSARSSCARARSAVSSCCVRARSEPSPPARARVRRRASDPTPGEGPRRIRPPPVRRRLVPGWSRPPAGARLRRARPLSPIADVRPNRRGRPPAGWPIAARPASRPHAAHARAPRRASPPASRTRPPDRSADATAGSR